MTRLPTPSSFLVVVLMSSLSVLWSIAFAQDDPFAPSGKKDAAKAGDEDPFSGKKVDKKKAAPPENEILRRRAEHPLINELRDSKPKTLEDLTDALKITLQLNRDDEFKRYAKAWMALKPSAADMAALQRKHGSAIFMNMARRKEYQPEGATIGMAVLEAASTAARDPLTLEKFIDQLSDTNVDTRSNALREISSAGPQGIVALLGALGGKASAEQRTALRDALVALRGESVAPLIGALEAPSPQLRADAISVLGRLKATEAVMYLIGPAAGGTEDAEVVDAARKALARITDPLPTPEETEAFLVRRINEYLKGTPPGKADDAGQISFWVWNPKSKSLELTPFDRDDAPIYVADRLSRDLLKFRADKPEVQRLALLAALDGAKRFGGLDKPLPKGKDTAHDAAVAAGETMVLNVLSDALKRDLPFAASAAAEVLGEIGKAETLSRYPNGMSPLVEAVGHADRRVSSSALNAVLTIGPTQSFPGSSRVVEALRHLLSGGASPRILIGHPQLDEGKRIAALCTEVGYEADSDLTGGGVLRLARSNGDYELVLLSEALDHPNVLETVQGLRRDSRSAFLPVGIMQHEVNPGRSAQAAKDSDPRSLLVTPPHSVETLEFHIQRLLDLMGKRAVPFNARLEQKEAALAWLVKLLARRANYPQYDLSRLEATVENTLGITTLEANSLRALGLFGTPKAQSILAEQAALSGSPVEQRREAVKQFEVAVKANGVLLTQKQLQHQYDLYNSLPAGDQVSREILGKLIDVVEAPRAPKDAETVKP